MAPLGKQVLWCYHKRWLLPVLSLLLPNCCLLLSTLVARSGFPSGGSIWCHERSGNVTLICSTSPPGVHRRKERWRRKPVLAWITSLKRTSLSRRWTSGDMQLETLLNMLWPLNSRLWVVPSWWPALVSLSRVTRVKYQVLFHFSRPFLAKWLCPKAFVKGPFLAEGEDSLDCPLVGRSCEINGVALL